MDHWPFERAGEQEAAVVNGWITVSNTNRDLMVAAALAGEGVIRSVDIAIEDHLRMGRLVPALLDWDGVDSPMVRLMYRPAAGRLRRRGLRSSFSPTCSDVERRCAALAGNRPDSKAPAWAGSRSYRRVKRCRPARHGRPEVRIADSRAQQTPKPVRHLENVIGSQTYPAATGLA